MDLRGKKFLITGASSGIGAATARQAAAKGAPVILVARSAERLQRVAESIRDSGGAARVYVADLSDFEAVRTTAARIQQDEGVPDIIMNNAGAGPWKFAHETTPEEAARMMAVPYLGAFAVTRAFLPQMIARRSGVIVNVTSVAAFLAWPGAAAYIAARRAMAGFNDALRVELRPHGIAVMLAAFAKVATEYWQNNPGSEKNLPAGQALIPELTPDDAARFIVAGIEKGKSRVIEPRRLRMILALARLFPGAL
ncbi:MAG: SDR family NAD(P)-dependent oxidoreductase [Alphaproteobacteria bacterium]|nr:SDR family NAD(P)-dependent oxidoreductase [Alphaproteobacteria bacterium]